MEGTGSRQREKLGKCSEPEETWPIWVPGHPWCGSGTEIGGDRSRAQGWRGHWGQTGRVLSAELRPGDKRLPYRTHVLQEGALRLQCEATAHGRKGGGEAGAADLGRMAGRGGRDSRGQPREWVPAPLDGGSVGSPTTGQRQRGGRCPEASVHGPQCGLKEWGPEEGQSPHAPGQAWPVCR